MNISSESFLGSEDTGNELRSTSDASGVCEGMLIVWAHIARASETAIRTAAFPVNMMESLWKVESMGRCGFYFRLLLCLLHRV